MYEKAFRAASDGAKDAFKDLPRAMQNALNADGIQDFINAWDDLPDKIKDAQRALDIKAKKLKEIIDLVEEMNEEFKEQVLIEQRILEEERDRASTLQEFIQRQATLDRHIDRSNQKIKQGTNFVNAMRSSYLGVTNAQNALNASQSKFTAGQKANALFGGLFGKSMSGLVGTFRALTGGGLAMFATLGRGLRMVINTMTEAYQVSRNFGFGVGESVGNVGQGISDFFRNIAEGRVTSLAQNVELRNTFSRQLGTRNVNSTVMDAATDMTNYYRLTAQEATRVSSALYRNNRFNAAAVKKDYEQIQALAQKNQMSPGELLRDVANYGNVYATYADKGAAAFARASIEVRKMGTDIGRIGQLADSIVNDFEGSLMNQATVQAMLPGMDFSEMMYASQYGTEEDVSMALRSMLGGRDIMNMPRSQRNAIARAMNMSMEELRNYSAGVAPEAGTTKDASPEELSRSALGTLVGSLDRASMGLGVFTLALAAASAQLGMRMGAGLIGGGSKLLGSVGRLGAVGGFLAGGLSSYNQYNTSKAAGESTGSAAINAGITGVGALGGTLAGAKLGAILGTALFPGIGTALGGLAGGLVGGIGGNMFGEMLVNLRKAEVKHSGGIVGNNDNVRMVNAALFHNAPRYHNGLMPDEVPTILQRGEAVLSRSQLATMAQFMGQTATPKPLSLDADATYLNIASAQYAASGVGGNMVRSTQPANTLVQSNSRIESLLEQLIQITREGKIINMDGRKVGSAVVTAFSRE